MNNANGRPRCQRCGDVIGAWNDWWCSDCAEIAAYLKHKNGTTAHALMHSGESDPPLADTSTWIPKEFRTDHSWRPGTGTGTSLAYQEVAKDNFARSDKYIRDRRGYLPWGYGRIDCDYGCMEDRMSGFYDPSKDPKITAKAQEAWKRDVAHAESTADKIAVTRAQNDLLNQPVLPPNDAGALACALTIKHDLSPSAMHLLFIMLRNTTRSGVVNKSRKQIAKEFRKTELSVTRNANVLRKAGLLVETGESRLNTSFPYEMTKAALHMPKGVLE